MWSLGNVKLCMWLMLAANITFPSGSCGLEGSELDGIYLSPHTLLRVYPLLSASENKIAIVAPFLARGQNTVLFVVRRFASAYMYTIHISPRVLSHAFLYFILTVISRYRRTVFQESSEGRDALPGAIDKDLFNKWNCNWVVKNKQELYRLQKERAFK